MPHALRSGVGGHATFTNSANALQYNVLSTLHHVDIISS